MSEWISVKDRMPEADGDYLVYGNWESGKTAIDIVDFAVHDGHFRTVWNFTVTHWCYLPEPPKEGDAE